jgi:hypothetical protein
MKLTWFAETTIRIHIGGEIFVADPGLAPAGVDRWELLSGANRTFGLAIDDPALAVIDAAVWRPRRVSRPIDDAAPPPVDILRIAAGSVLIDAVGEPPLVLLAGSEAPFFGRWADDAAIVLFGAAESLVALGTVLLDVSPPRLLALAADEEALDLSIEVLREHVAGTGIVSLEPGLALEV